MHAAVRLGHADFEVAAVAGGVQVVDGERAGRHRGLVDHHAVLAHGHLGIAVGDAAHGGRVAAQRLRQHAVVGGQLHAAQAEAVEDLAAGPGVAQGQLRAQLRQVALRVGGDVLPVVAGTHAASAGLPVQRGVVAQVPAAQVQPGVQAEVRRGLRQAAAAGAVAVEVVVEQAGVHPGVPVLRVDVAARLLSQVGLRHAGVQAQVGHREAHAGAGNHAGDVDADAVVGQVGADARRQFVRVQPQPVEQRRGHAGRGAGLGRCRSEAHVGTAERAAIEEDVDAVAAGRNEIAAFEARQVGGVLARAGKQVAVEAGLDGRRAGIRARRGGGNMATPAAQRQADQCGQQPAARDGLAPAGKRGAGAPRLHGAIVPW